MRPEFAEVVEQLRWSRSLPWLRVIDDAQLDRQAEEEPSPATVVAPYRWLVQRVGDGVRLTQAGYLPPALVTEAMSALGWQDGWYGKHNREDLTQPILGLRQSAQRFGLLRKNRGQLLATKAGRSLVAELAEAVLAQFPGCPAKRAERIARHAASRGSGRIGRTSAGRALDPDAVRLAVVAAVRHEDTRYEDLLMSGVTREEARGLVRDEADQVLQGWRAGLAQAGSDRAPAG